MKFVCHDKEQNVTRKRLNEDRPTLFERDRNEKGRKEKKHFFESFCFIFTCGKRETSRYYLSKDKTFFMILYFYLAVAATSHSHITIIGPVSVVFLIIFHLLRHE